MPQCAIEKGCKCDFYVCFNEMSHILRKQDFTRSLSIEKNTFLLLLLF